MTHTFCCTKPSVALVHFIVVYSNKHKQYSYEHHETTRDYLSSAR